MASGCFIQNDFVYQNMQTKKENQKNKYNREGKLQASMTKREKKKQGQL